MKRLTAKQERFVTEYIRSGSGTQAAIVAGYSTHTAHSIGCENLSKPIIRSRIDELQALSTSDKVLTVLGRKQILSDIARNGNVKVTNPVEAIKELNKLGGDYPPQQHLIGHKVIFEVNFVKRKQLDVVVEIPETTISSIEGEITKEEE